MYPDFFLRIAEIVFCVKNRRPAMHVAASRLARNRLIFPPFHATDTPLRLSRQCCDAVRFWKLLPITRSDPGRENDCRARKSYVDKTAIQT